MKLLSFKNIGEVLILEKIRPKLREYLVKAGINKVPYEMYGKLFYSTLILDLLIYLVFILKNVTYSILAFFIWSILALVIIDIILIFLFMLIMYSYYSTRIYNRTKKIEEVLPGFLDAVKINLEAGMSFDEALLSSLEPDFSILETEIEIVAEKMMTGEDTEDALKEFGNKYNSLLLNEVVDLMIVGLRGGADMTHILKRLIESINMNNYLKRTVINSVMGYVIFITVIAVVIAPVLFALSYNLLVIFEGFGSKLGASATEYLSFEFNSLIEKEKFITFSRFCITVIALFSSLIIVNLKKGSVKGGWKYMPIYVGIAWVLYEIMFRILTATFGKVF